MTPRVKKYLPYFQFLTSFISSYPASVIKKKKKETTATKTIIMFKLWASFGPKLIVMFSSHLNPFLFYISFHSVFILQKWSFI